MDGPHGDVYWTTWIIMRNCVLDVEGGDHDDRLTRREDGPAVIRDPRPAVTLLPAPSIEGAICRIPPAVLGNRDGRPMLAKARRIAMLGRMNTYQSPLVRPNQFALAKDVIRDGRDQPVLIKARFELEFGI